MVLSIISEEPRTARTHNLARYATRPSLRPITNVKQPDSSKFYKNSSRSTSLSTSARATRTTTTSLSTDDTLSMISTPWSTETWKSAYSPPPYSSSSRSTSVAPESTTTYAVPSPEVNSYSEESTRLNSKGKPLPLVTEKQTPPARSIRLKSVSTSTYSSWTLETYTSTGLVSDVVKVNYPWSPNTFSSANISCDYPSTVNLVSQKCSRETIGKDVPLSPMNYVVACEDNPMWDWVLVKQRGVLIT